jgi:dihydroneopterin aldolase
MGLAASDVPESWDVTSDSLAAWLAGTLGAARLLLVKSRDVEPPVTARDLADAGVVDPLFPLYAQRSGAAVHVAGPASLARADALFRSGGMPGVSLTRESTARS